MWAWLRTTASSVSGGTGKETWGRVGRRTPHTVPQSRRRHSSPTSTRCMEPVTVCAAPQKVRVGAGTPRSQRMIIALLYRDRASLSGELFGEDLERVQGVAPGQV